MANPGWGGLWETSSFVVEKARDAAKIQMKRGTWIEWLFTEFDETVPTFQCGEGTSHIFHHPSDVKHGPFVAGTRPRLTTVPAKATFVFVHSFGEVCLSKGISSGSFI